MIIFKCKMCGGSLEIEEKSTLAKCTHCESTMTIPRIDDIKRRNLYDRANHYRRINEFDKAMSLYENILLDDYTDAEAYWSLLLCKYGVDYVEDPLTRKRILTCNRTIINSIFQDEDYIKTIEYASNEARYQYEVEAKEIASIQKRILEISSNVEPYDIFICYKETDQYGVRTQDSVICQEIYSLLNDEGYRVFFSRITLESIIGSAYEPYIYGALISAKIMLVVGTKIEYFNSPWVKNEWSRYIGLIKNSSKKSIIPIYKDIDPYDLPEEFLHLQALDLNNIGSLQDLLRGINKLLKVESRNTVINENSLKSVDDYHSLLRRAFICLEDSDFVKADELLEKVLNLAPETSQAYIGKLMVRLKIKSEIDILNIKSDLVEFDEFRKALRFSKNTEYESILFNYNKSINISLLLRYVFGLELLRRGVFDSAKHIFEDLDNYRSSKLLTKETEYQKAIDLFLKEDYIKSRILFSQLSDYKDSNSVCLEIDYLNAMKLLSSFRYKQAIIQFRNLNNYKDSRKRYKDIYEFLYNRTSLSAGDLHTVYLKVDGTVTAVGSNIYGQTNVSSWTNIISVAAGTWHTVGLREDGTVVFTGNTILSKDLSRWDNIISIAAGNHTVGLKSDGTVVAVGNNGYGQLNVSDWVNIVAIAAGKDFTIGLKEDGTVVGTGENTFKQLSLTNWKDIVSIAAGAYHTVGLKQDGTVLSIGDNTHNQTSVGKWNDIISIAAGSRHSLGVNSKGQVFGVGDNKKKQIELNSFNDIFYVSAGNQHSVGIKTDDSLVSTGDNGFHQCDVDKLSKI